jgi:hypothetical protein
MAIQTCMGATMKCSFGLAPSKLIPTPKTVMTSNMVAANILDHIPFTNIPPFGMCQAPTNPAVIATTAAAMGAPTPAPCVPGTPAPWLIGAPTVMLCNAPALNNTSKLMCIWGGVIQFIDPGQTTHMIPP